MHYSVAATTLLFSSCSTKHHHEKQKTHHQLKVPTYARLLAIVHSCHRHWWQNYSSQHRVAICSLASQRAWDVSLILCLMRRQVGHPSEYTHTHMLYIYIICIYIYLYVSVCLNRISLPFPAQTLGLAETHLARKIYANGNIGDRDWFIWSFGLVWSFEVSCESHVLLSRNKVSAHVDKFR